MGATDDLSIFIHKLLHDHDLSFRDFMEVVLYHPVDGYYSKRARPEHDYITSPRLSPLFSTTLGKLVQEFDSHVEDGSSTIVDVGCGDGSLLQTLSKSLDSPPANRRLIGVDRTLERLGGEARENGDLRFVSAISEVPAEGAHLVLANELFDALPFARLVQRGDHLHELWVTEREGGLDWTEHEAPGPYEDYFAGRGITLEDGQFADVSLEWEELYREICGRVQRGMVVTFDYGFAQEQLFQSRVRRFGTAAAYRQQRVTRDLFAAPGQQDITAHINFTDLIRAGEDAGFRTLFFGRQAAFLLALGAAEDPLVQSAALSVEEWERRENARRLILPDGIGEDIRVLVQSRGLPEQGWSFQRKLY